MADLMTTFKNVYISSSNTDYIFDYVFSKYKSHTFARKKMVKDKYRKSLLSLQDMIYNSYFPKILEECEKKGEKVNLEEILLFLNKMTINRLDSMLINESQSQNQTKKATPKSTFSPTPPTPPPTPAVDPVFIPATAPIVESVTVPVPAPSAVIKPEPLESNVVPVPIQMPAPAPAPVDVESQKQKIIHYTDTDTDVNDNKVMTRYYQMFSSKSVFDDGVYLFPIDVKRLLSIGVCSTKIRCDLYNITNDNNTVRYYEKGEMIEIVLQTGYYKIHEILEMLTKLFNQHTKHEQTYSFSLNKHKNRITIESDDIFNIEFVNSAELHKMLGFNYSRYINNNKYIAEERPNHDVFSTLYMKLFINDKELHKVTTNANFDFFYEFELDVDNQYGKMVTSRPLVVETIDIFENLDVSGIKVEFWNSPTTKITQRIDFSLQFVVDYEC